MRKTHRSLLLELHQGAIWATLEIYYMNSHYNVNLEELYRVIAVTKTNQRREVNRL